MSDTFAVGDWHNDEHDVDCPLATCNLDNERFASSVGEDFDERARAKLDILSVDVITEEEAKDIWESLINYYEHMEYEEKGGSEASEVYVKKAELAKRAKHELGW